MTTDMIRTRPVTAAAVAIAVVGAVTILGAWFFQYGLGLKPCPLCLEQRYAYYFAIPLAVMVVLGDHAGASRKVLLAALIAIALGMLWNAGLGVYHSGVEWRWWQGPQECSGALDDLGSAGGLLNKLNATINDILKEPDVKAKYEALHLLPGGGSPQEMGAFVKEETQRWGEVIRAAKIQAE